MQVTHSWRWFIVGSTALAVIAATGCHDSSPPQTSAGVTSTEPAAKWVARALPTNQIAFSHVVCAGESRCIATGGNTKNGAIVGTVALVSTDAGATWRLSSLPPDVGRNDYSFDIACIDEMRCIGVLGYGGRLIVTTDGGVTWSDLHGPDAAELSVISCAEATCTVAGVREEDRVLETWRSNDGGMNWVRSGSPDVRAWYVQFLTCPTARRCYVTTSTTESEPEFRLFVSNDGGGSWTDRTPRGALLVGEIECSNEDSCIVNALPWIVQTSDGGVNWERRRGALLDGGSGAISCGANGLCIQAGGKSAVGRSEDGGRNWAREALPADTVTDVADVSCALRSGCVAVASQVIDPRATPAAWRFAGVVLTRNAW